MNADLEWSYYVKVYDDEHGVKSPSTVTAGEHCSAFVATGSYTKDGRPVVAHNNWTNYADAGALDDGVRRACRPGDRAS